jgi:hypothetical protein
VKGLRPNCKTSTPGSNPVRRLQLLRGADVDAVLPFQDMVESRLGIRTRVVAEHSFGVVVRPHERNAFSTVRSEWPG